MLLMFKKLRPIFKSPLAWLAATILIAGLGWSVYQLPAVHSRLAWRIDIAMTYLRGVFNPAGSVPTAASHANGTELPLLEATPTPFPTATLYLTGEATAMVQPLADTPTPTITPSPTPLPTSVSLANPEYEKQGLNNCGPATMAMYLRFYGWKGDQNTITAEIKPLDSDRNVNVEELAYYVRNFAGWLNIQYRVGGNVETLKKFLAAGFPVMIEGETVTDQRYWPNDDMWAGHYLLVTGYNEADQTFQIMDAFRDYQKTMTYAKMMNDWQAFNYVYILVYPPEQEGTIQNLLGEDWNVDVNRQNALDLADAETKARPEDPYAWFNLGSNLVYFGRYAEAAAAYDTSRALHLPQRMLRYQFGPFFAYFHSGRTEDLNTLADFSLKLTPNSEEAMLWKGWALYRLGDLNGAITYFRKSYAANPTNPDAKYALDFVGATP